MHVFISGWLVALFIGHASLDQSWPVAHREQRPARETEKPSATAKATEWARREVPPDAPALRGPVRHDGSAKIEERPGPAAPRQPWTPEQLEHREAKKLYGLAIWRQHQDRLIEACHLLEEALQHDASAAPIHRALVPLYLALGRPADALKASRQTLDLDPGDFESWATLARLLKCEGKLAAARDALARGLQCEGLADQLDIALQMRHDYALLCEETEQWPEAQAAFAEVARTLDDPRTLLELHSVSEAELKAQAANTYERLIKVCIKAQQPDKALAVFASARKLHPELSRRLSFHLAKIHAAAGRREEALEHLEAYLRTQPQGVEAYEFKLSLLRDLGRSAEILDSLRQDAGRDAQNVALQLLLARQYAQANQAPAAAEIYERLAETTPTGDVYRDWFQMELHARGMSPVVPVLDAAIAKSAKDGLPGAGDPQAAAKARAMLQALREHPDLAQAMVASGDRWLHSGKGLHSQTALLLAVLATRGHQLTEAERFYRYCLDQKLPASQAAGVYTGLLQALWQANKLEAIIDVCHQGLRNGPTASAVLFDRDLSQALVLLGKIEEALAAADKAIELAPEPGRLEMKLNRLFVLERADRYQEALALGKQLLEEYRKPGEVRHIRLRIYAVYAAEHDWPHAEEQLQLVLRADPNDATANNDLGYLWAEQGKRLEEAERLIQKALTLDEQQWKWSNAGSPSEAGANAAFLDSMGWVLFRRGRAEAARSWLERAAAAGEADPTIWDHLGDVHWHLHDREQARAAWQKALSLYDTEKRRRRDDHYQELKVKLQRLDAQSRQP